MSNLEVDPKRLKMLRETLCFIQSRLDTDISYDYIDDIQLLIDEIDRHRPLDSNGKHGNLHTSTCGCEDES